MPPTFPDVPRIELKQPPLELVVCQVRFPLVLGLVNNQPPEQFHKEIRCLYPVTRRSPPPSGPIEPAHTPVLRLAQAGLWLFEDKEQVWTVSLGIDSLSLETRPYPSFDVFVDRFLDLLAIGRRIYGIDIRDRLGLRYHDRICKTSQPFLPSDWFRLVRPQLLPLRDFCGAGEPQMSHLENRFFFGGDRMLTFRTAFFDSGYPGIEEDMLLIDLDCYTEKRREMDGIREDLYEFKRITYNAFRWALGGLGDCFEDATEPETPSVPGESP